MKFHSLLAGWLLLACGCIAAASDATNPATQLIERSAIAMRVDPEASRRDAEKALELLKRQPDVDLQVRAHLLLCDYLSERDRAAAEQQIAEASELLPQLHRQGLRAGLYECQGAIQENAADNSAAHDFYERAVSVATQAHDNEMLASSLFARGYLLGLQGQYATGLADLRHAQSLYEQLNLPHHALTTLNSIAALYKRMGDYEQALHIYERALKLQREAGMLREEAVTLHNLGRAYESLERWPDARQQFSAALQISHQLDYPRGESYALRGLAAVATATGAPAEALDILERAATLQSETPDARLSAQIDLVRGVALHQLKRFPESIAALDRALKVFTDASAQSELRATYAELAGVSAETGNWQAAYHYQVQSQATAEQLLRTQIDQQFSTLKVEFDMASRDKENQLLMRENEANAKALAQGQRARAFQRALIVLAVILAAVLGVLAWRQRRSRLNMQRLAMTDELTGVSNRRAIFLHVEPLLEGEQGSACALLIVDIDHFKSINDVHGHPAGDEALRCVANQLRATVHEPAMIGRLGGEEFVVVLPDTNVEKARQIAEELRQAVISIEADRWMKDRQITVSIGVTTSRPADTASAMLQRADVALYAAKRAGRNCVRVELTGDVSQQPPTNDPRAAVA